MAVGLLLLLLSATPEYAVNSEVLMLKIVPTDHLVARILVSNRDIGFVHQGQSLQVHVDAFPCNEFGELKGRVQSIGSDVLTPDQACNFFRFPVTAALDCSFLRHWSRNLILRSGMSISANVVLRQRPLIAIFTQQLLPFWGNLQKL
jgi:HlyD family secretion protein